MQGAGFYDFGVQLTPEPQAGAPESLAPAPASGWKGITGVEACLNGARRKLHENESLFPTYTKP